MKLTVNKIPTWSIRRSTAREHGLLVIAVFGIFLGLCVTTQASLHHREPKLKGVPSIDNRSSEALCFTPGCVRTASTILKNMDQSIDPCDDFYKFTCGSFIKSTIIPDDKAFVDMLSIVEDETPQQLRTIIEAKSESNELKSFGLVKNFYKSCMNTSVIEERGLEPLRTFLEPFGGWPVLVGNKWNDDDFDLYNMTYKFIAANAEDPHEYLIDITMAPDSKNSSQFIIYLDQPIFQIGREHLTKGLEDKIVEAYYKLMVEVAVMLGAEKEYAMSELEKSLLFEIKLANISVPDEQRRNKLERYNPMTFTELAKKYPSIRWKEHLQKVLSPIQFGDDEVVIVAAPTYITNLEKLLNQTSKRILANYLMTRAILPVLAHLNEDVRKLLSVDFADKYTGEPLWKQCIAYVSNYLPISISAMYIRNYFNEEAKKNAVNIVMNIQQQVDRMLREIEWMDKKTKESALEKVSAIASHVAYPDELLDDDKLEKYHENLELFADNFFENFIKLKRWQLKKFANEYRLPVNKADWTMFVTMTATVYADYYSPDNSIDITAGILQGLFFDNDRPEYMNYGGIGTVVGQKIIHALDNEGKQYDKEGNLANWWTPAAEKNYLERAQCIIDQYGNYTMKEVGLNLNGINTQGENIADNGGLKLAYLAYLNTVESSKTEAKLPGLDYTPKQMFWISAASIYCSKIRLEKLKDVVESNYSPDEFRVLGAMSNMLDFAKDFSCPIGSKMNPAKKCIVW